MYRSQYLRPIYTCLFSVVQLIVVSAQRCEKLDPELFPSCVNIGHNQTFKIPSHIDKERISDVLRWINKYRSNCSVSISAANAVDCAFFLPLCEEGRKTPLFPCRRVCAEMVLGCSKTASMSLQETEFLGAWCSVLPNLTAASGECFEPKNFKLTVNQNDFPSLGKCYKRVIPMCGDQGYDYTILSSETQAEILKDFFNKTMNSPSLNASDYSLAPFFEKQIKKYPKCAAETRKMFCTNFLPPCFPGKSKQKYGLCKSVCSTLTKDCPDLFRSHREDLEYCADFPDGETYKGFCSHTSWPKSVPLWFIKRTTPVPPTKGSKTNPGVIAAAVIVPLVVLVAVAVTALFLVRRRYDVTRTAYSKQRDDVVSIVDDE